MTNKDAVETHSRVIKSAAKQLLYSVVLEPDTEDAQGDVISAEEIEKAAHDYLISSRVIGEGHEFEAQAAPVESFIAPVDMEVEGEAIKKGSWVIVMKIFDSALWDLVEKGVYGAVSIGGLGHRTPLESPPEKV